MAIGRPRVANGHPKTAHWPEELYSVVGTIAVALCRTLNQSISLQQLDTIAASGVHCTHLSDLRMSGLVVAINKSLVTPEGPLFVAMLGGSQVL